MRVHVYVDGFNFYYRLFKNQRRKHPLPRSYKWLNIHALACALEPAGSIEWIGYFTAYVSSTTNDPFQHERQRAYIEALKTISCLEVVPGNFLSVRKWGVPIGGNPAIPIEFTAFEEKGSDVNLACRLVLDGARQSFDHALVITNDGDLVEPVRIVTQDIGLPVTVISPDVNINGKLRTVATEAKTLDTKLFRNCLFSDQLTNAAGVPITKPQQWS